MNLSDRLGLCSKNKKGDAEAEKNIIRFLRGGEDSGWLFDVTMAYYFHSGGGPMDYAARPSPNIWQLRDGTTLKSNQFGNYMAGYDAGYSCNALLLYTGVRIGGMIYGANGSSEGWTDSGSVPDINSGFAEGVVDKAIDDALSDPTATLILNVLDKIL